jgi:hypothetical protein
MSTGARGYASKSSDASGDRWLGVGPAQKGSPNLPGVSDFATPAAVAELGQTPKTRA